jgi:Asp-tRNA(Asn)/Glu-tRNA(Gln) amidotransferase A subunit family amidase
VPELRPGVVVVTDNLSSHKRPIMQELIEAAKARLLFLPPYSPDFNPIEKAFSRLKAMLRKIGEGTVSGLWNAIGSLVDIFQPAECAFDFSACRYDPDRSKNALTLARSRASIHPAGQERHMDENEYQALKDRLHEVMADFRARLGHFDLMAMPGTPLPAIPVSEVDDTAIPMSRYTRIGNCLGLCAISLPNGFTAAGLPTGFQLMAWPGQDALLLAFAEHLGDLAPA